MLIALFHAYVSGAGAMLLPAFSTDPYHMRVSGGIYGMISQGGDPESIYNQFDPPPATLAWSVDPYHYRVSGNGPNGSISGGGDPDSIFNTQPCGVVWEDCM